MTAYFNETLSDAVLGENLEDRLLDGLGPETLTAGLCCVRTAPDTPCLRVHGRRKEAKCQKSKNEYYITLFRIEALFPVFQIRIDSHSDKGQSQV